MRYLAPALIAWLLYAAGATFAAQQLSAYVRATLDPPMSALAQALE